MDAAEKSTKLAQAVDLILWQDWDPIGVNDVPATRDEYGGYVAAVVQLLLNGADEASLANHLHTVERVSMGISSGLDHCRHVARKLLHEYSRLG